MNNIQLIFLFPNLIFKPRQLAKYSPKRFISNILTKTTIDRSLIFSILSTVSSHSTEGTD